MFPAALFRESALLAVDIVNSPRMFRPMMGLVLPVLAEQTLGMLVYFSDRLLAGRFFEDPAPLAAITLMSYVLWAFWGVCSVVAIGATALVARHVGAGRWGMARRVNNQAFLLAAVVALLIAIFGGYFGHLLPRFFNFEDDALQIATVYLMTIMPSLPLLVFQTVGLASLRGSGDMITGLIVMAIVNTINVLLSWSLVIGLGPLPKMGVQGIAVGTALGIAAGAILVLLRVTVMPSRLRLSLRMLRPRLSIIRSLLRIGIPGGCESLSIIGAQVLFVGAISKLGNAATAAHGLALGVESLMFMPAAAFQTAASTMAGQYLGALDQSRARQSVMLTLATGGGLMVLCAVLIYCVPLFLARLFVSAGSENMQQVAVTASQLLRTVAIATPAFATMSILNGGLRGAGDTRFPMMISLVGLLGVRVPGAYWLAMETIHIPWIDVTIQGWGLGVLGAWYAMTTDLCVRAALTVYRFSHGGWMNVKL